MVKQLELEPDASLYIQDDRIGKGLFKFYRSRHKDVFFRLALRVIKIFRPVIDRQSAKSEANALGAQCPALLPWFG